MIKGRQGGFQWQNWDVKSGYRPARWRSTVSAPSCAFCNKTVYPAEEIVGAGQKFHKLCLKCTICYTLLNTSNHHEHDKKIYCGTCYRRQIVLRKSMENLPIVETPRSERTSSVDLCCDTNSILNSSRTSTKELSVRSSMPNLLSFKSMSNSVNQCPRCSKNVYIAEEIRAGGKSYHKLCFSCANCKGSVNGGRYSIHAGELYHDNCYKRLFGSKGVSISSN